MRFSHCCFWLSALTILSSLSCKKGDNTEDAPVGNGTFTCLLNGEQWKPCLKDEFIPGGGLSKLTVNTNDQRILKIMAIRNCKDGQDESLRINCSSIADDLSIGKWSINLTDRLGCGKKDYQLDSTYNNIFKLTRFDQTPITGVATGEFDVRFVNLDPTCTDTIHLSKGKFNLKIQF